MFSLKSIFSISSITQKSLLLVKRFPIPVILLIVLAVKLFVQINNIINNYEYELFQDFSYRLYIFLAFGAVISVTAALFFEDLFGLVKQHIFAAAVLLLWGVYCFFLPATEELDDLARGYIIYKAIEIAAIYIIFVLSLFFICYLKRNTDKPYWNFGLQIISQYFLAAFFGLVLYIGLTGAYLAVRALFGYSFDHHIFWRMAILCFVLFTPIYFMANLPDKTVKYSDNVLSGSKLKIFGFYILSPIAAIYIAILYAYLFRIVYMWELPRGLVSWLVSALAIAGLFIITILYPARITENNKIINFISRYFGVIILPLLILMTVGIIRRISDYGITVERFYILVLNLWFYGIYAHIYLTGAQKIKWIYITGAALIFITSTGYWSITNVTKHILSAEVGMYLGDTKLPFYDRYNIGDSHVIAYKENRNKIVSKLNYLSEFYGYESIDRFFISSESDEANDSITSRNPFSPGRVAPGFDDKDIQELPVGSTTAGLIRDGSQFWFKLNAKRNAYIIVETTGDVDTIMEAYDDEFDSLYFDDDSGEDYNARIELYVNAGKVYYFVIEGYDEYEDGLINISARYE
jgi:hypothetical protein